MAQLAPDQWGNAASRLIDVEIDGLRLLDFEVLSPSLHQRCDNSNGAISDVMTRALKDLVTVATLAKPDAKGLAERVLAGVLANDHGQFDGLIGLMAGALGQEGLALLKAKFEKEAAKPGGGTKQPERRVIGISTRGPIFSDDFEARYAARRVRSALTEIADALGDVDGYIARFSAPDQTNPAIAAAIAQRLLGAHRPVEALAALERARASLHGTGHWPDWHRLHIDVLDALRRTAEAQSERWANFERNLNAGYLRAYLKRLPDFDDEEAEARALAHVCQHDDVYQALDFLMEWPAHKLAADLILTRHA